MNTYLKKSYCFKNTPTGAAMRTYHGHVKRATAMRHGFSQVVLSVIDLSGKGRGENRAYYGPFFPRLQ